MLRKKKIHTRWQNYTSFPTQYIMIPNLFPTQCRCPKCSPSIERQKSIARCSFLCKFLFNVSDCFPRIQMLRTDPGAIHNRMTSVQFECIIQLLQPLILKVITWVFNPPVCLHQDRRAKVFVCIPPVGRTCRAAACAEDAFVHAIEFGPILTRLQEFCLSVYLAIFGLKPRFNGAILLVDCWEGSIQEVTTDEVNGKYSSSF